MRIFVRSVTLLSVFFSVKTVGGQEWTWLYKKVFTPVEIQEHGTKKQLFFLREQLPPFTQLMFSWNAHRPTKGHFAFFASVRDAQTQQWSAWLKMMEWGNGMQRSYLSEESSIKNAHVRLEMGKNRHADAFKLKIEAIQDAQLSDIKAIAVAVSHFEKFEKQEDDASKIKLPSVHISDVPLLSQRVLDHPRSDGLCSPTSCAMLTSFLTKRPIDPIIFAEKSYDTGLDAYGSWPFNMAHAFEACEGKFFFVVQRLNSFEALHEKLQKQIPVVVSVRGYLDGAAKVMPHGHLMVVVGYDAKHKRVLCHDPAFPSEHEVFKAYKLKSFLAAWERSHRLAYIAEPL
jgi:hypothetical protein